MVFTEQQLQVKKLVDVQQDIEIDALNDGVGALSSTMQNGFTEAANNFSDIQNSLGLMNSLSDERYNGLTGSVNALSNAMTQGFLDIGNTVANVAGEIQGQLNQMNANTGNMNDNIQNQFNDVNNYVGGFENNMNTALQGIQNTFYGMENDYLDRFNQVNANISDSINNFNEQITNELSVNVFSADTMIYNVSATPVSSLTALGYDSNGKIIPVTVIANQNVVLPENANYLYTDAAGTPYAGMADTAVSANENLVTSHAVYNAVNDVWTDLNEFHNEVSNSFGDVQNSFNAVDSTFAGIQNQFNNVNNAHNNLYQNVVDGFIDVWANFDSVNNNISSMNSNIQNQFNDVNVGVQNSLDYVQTTIDIAVMNIVPVNYYNSTSPIDYRNATNISIFTDSSSEIWGENTVNVGSAYIEYHIYGARNIFGIQPLGHISRYAFNYNMSWAFDNCTLIQAIQNLEIGSQVKYMQGTFCNCTNLNQNIVIPSSVTDVRYLFEGCSSLNQNILLPGVRSLENTFRNCSSLNQNIMIPNGLLYGINNSFRDCTSLNQSIAIPKSCRVFSSAFYGCTNLNQDIYIYSNKFDFTPTNAFRGCTLLATRNIHILSTVPLDTSNNIYNALVNNITGINWTGRIYNDLPEPTTWPPKN